MIAESSAAGADTELTIAKCGYQELRDKGIPVIDLKQKENARCTVEIEDGEVFKKINTWELVRDADANADNTVCIGVCCKKLADAKGFRWVVGCPPATPTSSRASSATARNTACATTDLLLTPILFTYSILPPMTTAAAERNICRRCGRFLGGA